MKYHKISDERYEEFKKICNNQGIKYETEAEYRDSANNLINFIEILLEVELKERDRKERLKVEPKGFALEGKGRNCSLCRESVYETNGWYDKWGFKCMNCQDAVDKRKIPGSLCGDYDDEKCITDARLSWRTGIHIQTIRKLIRRGDIKSRQIPNGPHLILRKDNPDILSVLELAQAEKNKSLPQRT